ncbi:hypothetical protein [Staphylococcus schleiferi]|uniref:hypothetical protein n=1 Tax=Staphylococcus schleiferi TaxID=1295 RepID=UPI0024812D71|nr:hypothetical protein [Staphylococcus schleiferi]
MNINILELFKWTELPKKGATGNLSNQYEGLRWLSQERVKGKCWPYKLAIETSLEVLAPFDITCEPLVETQVSVNDEMELNKLSEFTETTFWIKREKIYIGIRNSNWFRLYQYFSNGSWHPVFIPNGQGSLEWRLGWGIEIPEGYSILIQPIEGESRFRIHPGILNEKKLKEMNDSGLGLSIAIEPIVEHKINKGDLLCRIYVVKLDYKLNVEYLRG